MCVCAFCGPPKSANHQKASDIIFACFRSRFPRLAEAAAGSECGGSFYSVSARGRPRLTTESVTTFSCRFIQRQLLYFLNTINIEGLCFWTYHQCSISAQLHRRRAAVSTEFLLLFYARDTRHITAIIYQANVISWP